MTEDFDILSVSGSNKPKLCRVHKHFQGFSLSLIHWVTPMESALSISLKRNRKINDLCHLAKDQRLLTLSEPEAFS